MQDHDENHDDIFHQKNDIGCVICMKTSILKRKDDIYKKTGGMRTGIQLKSCSICFGPRQYCSKTCFRKDWAELGHQEECKLLAAKTPIQNLEETAAKIQKLKEEANALFKLQKYTEAIALYRDVKITAIRIRKLSRERHEKKVKEEAGKVVLPKYLTKWKDTVHFEKYEENLKVSHRPDPLECEMSRLSAIAANNSAVTYNKMGDSLRAHGAAREALKLDPLFAHKIFPQLLTAMAHFGQTEEFNEMVERSGRFTYSTQGISCGTVLYDLRFITYKQFVRKNNQYLYEVIEKEKKTMELLSSSVQSANVCVSVIPFRESHWITIGHKLIRDLFGMMMQGEYESLRVCPIDLSDADADHIDRTFDHTPGGMSHSATLEGLKNTHRETVLYVNDLEREGLKVASISLGCGLFHMLPEADDPQKEKRRFKCKAEKYVLHSGHFIPSYTCCLPQLQHVCVEKREEVAKRTSAIMSALMCRSFSAAS